MDNFAELVDMVRKSAIAILIYPSCDAEIDMKFAVELGVAVALGKRMILAIRPGTRVSDSLVSICERIVEIDANNPRASGEGLLEMLREMTWEANRDRRRTLSRSRRGRAQAPPARQVLDVPLPGPR